MMTTDEKVALTRQQLARAERALEALQRDVLPLNQARYDLMAESYLAQIAALRAELDDLMGVPQVAVPQQPLDSAAASGHSQPK